jgi:hypothetical protein
MKIAKFRGHSLPWGVHTTSPALMRSQNYVILPVLLVVGAVCSYAQTPDPRPEHGVVQEDRPPLTPLPAEQDWSFLRDASKRVDPLDKLKYVPIGDSAQRYLSSGLDYRGEYEYFDNWAMGAGPQDHNGYLLNRVMPHFDLHFGTEVRLFTEFQFGYEAYRNGGPRPGLDEDKGDVHQSFLEVGSRVSHERGFSLRAGRQEIVLGSGKLFDNNEGLNVKLSFDGVRFIAQSRIVRWDAFAAKPVEDNPGFFDDGPIHTQTSWGSYLTIPSRLGARGFADLYYLGLSTKNASYSRGSGIEFRHTIGIRAFRLPARGWDYNWEANIQFGSLGSSAILSWSISTETAFQFRGMHFNPRIVLRADAYSGDHGSGNEAIGTYNSYFPRGAYFTNKLVPTIGPQNLVDVHPLVQFQIKPSITGSFGWMWYWKESATDGVYGYGSGILIAPANTSQSGYVGTLGDLEIRWAPAPHFIVAVNMMGFRPGRSLVDQINARGPIAANTGIAYRF